jgi:uncharacterized protein YoaH (UPF0181 family)
VKALIRSASSGEAIKDRLVMSDIELVLREEKFMSAAAPCVGEDVFQPVSIDYHEMMAKTISVGRAVSAGANYLAIAGGFWLLSRRFTGLLADVNLMTHAPQEDLAALLPKFRELHDGINEIVKLSAKKNLLNRSLTAPSIRKVMAQNEQWLDIIDVYEVSLMSSTRADLEAAMHEYRAGQTVEFETLLSK